MKTIIERGASWTLEETKLLLALWGQDLVQRQATNQKRTKEVYEKISEKFNQSGYERTADQVRTRVFNMIAEYRRILKDPNPERVKKCIFFEALHKIYQAKHMDDVKSALDDYEPEYPYSPASNTISSEKGDESISDSEANEGNDTQLNNQSTTTINDNNHHSGSNSGSLTTSMSANSNNNNCNNNSASATCDNNGDSINSNANDISGMSTNNNTDNLNSHPTSAKKIKLETPKSGSNPSTSSEHANSRLNKSLSNQSNATPSTSSPATSNASASLSTNTPSNAKHQSLLMPHGPTSSATSTPITKLTPGNNAGQSYININSTKLPIIRTNQIIGNESINLNGTATTRLPTTAAIASHQLYQAPVNTFDVTSSALLIDRMFAHLSRESENMRDWIALEKERLAMERSRRVQETERETRRERVLVETLMKFQEQWLSFLTHLGPSVLENAPELNLPPPNEGGSATSESVSQTTMTSGSPSVTASTATPTTSSANTSSTSSMTGTGGPSTATSTASAQPSA